MEEFSRADIEAYVLALVRNIRRTGNHSVQRVERLEEVSQPVWLVTVLYTYTYQSTGNAEECSACHAVTVRDGRLYICTRREVL
jgi:hypothetical protein